MSKTFAQTACLWCQDPRVYVNIYYVQEEDEFLGWRVLTSSPAKDNKKEIIYLINNNLVNKNGKKWSEVIIKTVVGNYEQRCETSTTLGEIFEVVEKDKYCKT